MNLRLRCFPTLGGLLELTPGPSDLVLMSGIACRSPQDLCSKLQDRLDECSQSFVSTYRTI